MATELVHLAIEALDAERVARFWAAALECPLVEESLPHGRPLVRTPLLDIVAVPTPDPKLEKNRLHLDVVAESIAHQAETVNRLLDLGAEAVDIGQPDDADQVVLADPEGNEFCVVIRGEFLADTGVLGAVVFEPADHATGYFWSEATGWPVVYDQDGDTALRHPSGEGPFITFGPPGVPSKRSRNRLHLDITPAGGAGHDEELRRLMARGAVPVDIGAADQSSVFLLADPDGNEFCLLAGPG